MNIVKLTLPEFAFVTGAENDNDELRGRTVILHVHTATVMEIFDSSSVCLNADALHHDYVRHAPFFDEPLTIALHYSATLDDEEEIMQVMKRAAEWYGDYCDWEDLEIATNDD